ncbi:molybdopterin synthase sulfur carrier subunit [Halovenus sp. WSH3]|uniref:Molybdopterin synthase sulfur carrier subunit n=1 Tax=Halovenus carboxidivorans TaxID=2692199 RepID=A0A6B0T649_9EURY|nr:ubiquitin-like small modifier protein 1 [Halovenus carboxidivorans]MXR51666.1 molybdopterin synthase sulfur carrier subunit [Halovenus carboxidivorans]
MRWKLFATLSETVGDNVLEVSVDAEEPTLRDAFDALLAAHPELESQVLDEEGALQDHLRLLCDGEDPFHSAEGWETDLGDVEELAMFPPVTGG